MKPHDCEGLNDVQCWYADFFLARLYHWRCQPIEDRVCLVLARNDARARHPLDEREQAGVDAYLRERVTVERPERPELTRAFNGVLTMV